MAVHAHPDDECITMGGCLARYSDEGLRTALVCCTQGELATIVAPDMPEETHRSQLPEIRRGELREACRILGVGELHLLEYHDSGMAGAETNFRPEAFWKADLNEVTGRLVAHIRAFKPEVVATYDANGGYGHPDHVQTHRATLLAVEAAAHPRLFPEAGEPWTVSKLYYSAFPVSQARKMVEMARAAGQDSPFGDRDPEQLEFVAPDEVVTTVVSCRDTVARKRQALLAHRSQIAPDFPLVSLPDDVAAEHFGHEYFTLARSTVASGAPEDDLFAGLR
jgi:N-acetyl-1-D-myo-inositol-2-amino-2-deoxy-alpha-D-glucopyranoside deacetylase